MRHGRGHGVHMAGRAGHGLRNHAAFGVVDASRKVARLACDRSESGAQQRLRLFFDNGDQPVPHDLGADGFECLLLISRFSMTIWPRLLISALKLAADNGRCLIFGYDGGALDVGTRLHVEAPVDRSCNQLSGSRIKDAAAAQGLGRRLSWRLFWQLRLSEWATMTSPTR